VELGGIFPTYLVQISTLLGNKSRKKLKYDKKGEKRGVVIQVRRTLEKRRTLKYVAPYYFYFKTLK